jgi:hypothetical protein
MSRIPPKGNELCESGDTDSLASFKAERLDRVQCFCGRRAGFFFQPQINADARPWSSILLFIICVTEVCRRWRSNRRASAVLQFFPIFLLHRRGLAPQPVGFVVQGNSRIFGRRNGIDTTDWIWILHCPAVSNRASAFSSLKSIFWFTTASLEGPSTFATSKAKATAVEKATADMSGEDGEVNSVSLVLSSQNSPPLAT